MMSTTPAALPDDVYFADLDFKDPKFAGETFAYADAWIDYAQTQGYAQRWINNWRLYFGANADSGGEGGDRGAWNEHSFEIVGENGELVQANYNDFRNLLQHILNMTVSQPPNMSAVAINDDAASLVAAETFDGVFNYYMTTYRSGRLLKQSRIAVERAIVTDTGYMLCEWDEYAGAPTGPRMAPVLDPMTGQPVIDDLTGQPREEQEQDHRGQPLMSHEGDLYFKARSCWDVFFDEGCEDEDECDWVLVRDRVNKHEYAARYGAKDENLRARILSTSAAAEARPAKWNTSKRVPKKTNMIDVWKFYHRHTAMMPQGRAAILLDSDTVLQDGPNPYDMLPVFSIKAMEGLDSLIGYAPANVIAPVQESQNVLSSAMMTNFAAFGVQNIAVKDVDQFDVRSLAGGLNVLAYSDTKPEAMNLVQNAQGSVEFYGMLNTKGETLSGINSVTRGDPESSLKSGKALGIVQASAVQFQSALAASFAQFLKNVGNFMLMVFRKYAHTERVTQIVGENQEMQSATWSKDTFGPIDRVTAELVDPAMRTLGYRTDLAMFMAQNNMVANPQEFLTVLTTGNLKPMYRSETTELNTIRQENREMMDAATKLEAQMQSAGSPEAVSALALQLAPPVMEWDNDDLHQPEHKIVATSPAMRRNGAAALILAAHMKLHDDNRLFKAKKKALEAAKMQLEVQAILAPLVPQQPAPQPGAAPQQPAPEQQPV
jgi:hypothetical protein